mmetsp:Transcript_27927/g.30114  ORF Transcript_27927/g.30114 Transcript_27927/m.30114 type:complete len:453 (+) Transcript_27927:95-1453(+)
MLFSSSPTLSVVFSVLACCALLVPSLLPTAQGQFFGADLIMGLIPPDVLAVIPSSCQGGDDSEFTQAIDCVAKNFMTGCSGLAGVLDQFNTIIPTDASMVNNCDDIEASFCPIASQCSNCEAEFDTLARCIVTFTDAGVIDQSIIDLVDSCALVCDDNGVKDVGYGNVAGTNGSGAVAAPIGGTEGGTNADVVPVVVTTTPVVGEKDIVTTAIDNGSFTTLVTALQATVDLVSILQGDGPFTVFAPTDDAFAVLPAKLVPCLLLPENQAALTSILTYHVASGEVLSNDLSNGQQIQTVQGENVGISIATSTAGINDAPAIVKIDDNALVLIPDVLATNGVIHVIDAVLVPPTLDVTAFLTTCPEVNVVVPPADIVPVVPNEPTGEIVDQLGDILDGLAVDQLGETIGDAVGDYLGNESTGDTVGHAIDTVVQTFMGIINGNSLEGWGGFGNW